MSFDSDVERDRHLREIERVLCKHGWNVRLDRNGELLKYPYATNKNRTLKIWFRKRSVLAGPFAGQMNEARSLGMTTGQFLETLSDQKSITSLDALSRCF